MIKLNGKKADHPITRVSPKIAELKLEINKWYGEASIWRSAKTSEPIHNTEDIEYEDVTNKRLGE